jgi:ABC-2 type transport system permease protein
VSAGARRVSAVVKKELREYRRNRFILGTTVILPAIFLAVPLVNLFSISGSTSPSAVRALAESAELMMLIVPITLPTAIAAYSVIGERDQATLEPLLTTPVTERELIVGKAIAAIVPAVVIAYSLAAAFGVAVRIQDNAVVVSTVFDTSRIVAEILFAPLLAAWATWVAMAVSTRSGDVRVAQQLSTLGSLPMLGLTALFTFRVLTPSVPLTVVLAVALFVVDSLAWRFVSALFDRERLVSRYGS